jgi:hypothetical protein
MRVEETETGLRVTDQARRSTEVGLERVAGTEELGDGCYLHGDVDTGFGPVSRRFVAGANELRFDPVAVTVIDTSETPVSRGRLPVGERRQIGPDHLVVVHTPVLTHVRPSSTCQLRSDAGEVVISGTEEVSLGFESSEDWTSETVVVEDSPRGLAEYLSVCHVGMPDGAPDRTFPNLRDHPPAVEFTDDDGRTNVHEFENDAADHVTIDVPLNSDQTAKRSLVAIASLAYYLGARINPVSTDTVVLRSGDAQISLGADPVKIDQKASELLRRTFVLDCHARAAGPYGERLHGHDEILSEHGLDAETLYDLPMGERVVRYTETPDVEDDLPEWHLSVHVHPTLERSERLPRHLHTLADVVLPQSAALTTAGERAEWADGQRVRGGALVEPDVYVDPDSRSRAVGWDAPNTSLGAFNVDGMSRVRPQREEPVTVTVAHGSGDMISVGDSYDRVPAQMSQPSTAELARLIEGEADLLHYVGHHEDRGLECRDGFLDISSVDSVNLHGAFINACATEDLARELSERGALAAVGTTRVVSDEIASKVGREWATRVSLGWTFDRALRVAARDRPAGYVLFGDGTLSIRENDGGLPARVVESDQMEIDYCSPRRPGTRVSHPLSDDPVLSFTTVESDDEARREDVRELADAPVVNRRQA